MSRKHFGLVLRGVAMVSGLLFIESYGKRVNTTMVRTPEC
jgi:hypothetical protein